MKIVKESKFDKGDKVRFTKTLAKEALVNKGDVGEVLSVAYENDRFIYRVKFNTGYDCRRVEEDWIEPFEKLYPFELGKYYNVFIDKCIDLDLTLTSINNNDRYIEYEFSARKTYLTLRAYKED